MEQRIISRSKLFLGCESLRCPRCGRVNRVPVHTDLPDRQWLTCGGCGYRALLNCAPLLEKYGLLPGLNQSEKRTAGRYLQAEIAKI